MSPLVETEEQWQAWVIELAERLGWHWGHFGKCKVGKPGEERWVTPGTGVLGVGHPDLILARGMEVIYVECKADTGRLRKGQQEWIEIMRAAGLPVYIWRPRDRHEVQQTLE